MFKKQPVKRKLFIYSCLTFLVLVTAIFLLNPQKNQAIANEPDVVKKIREERNRPVSNIPDHPYPFGYKNSWLAIKSDSPQDVIDKLNLKVIGESNWQTGINTADRERWLFVSPSLDGFVLVVGLLGLQMDELKNMSGCFDELQYFETHRTVEHHLWIKFANDKLVRAYIFSELQVLIDEGELTLEEKKLGFEKFPTSRHQVVDWKDDEWDNDKLPSENDVLDIAAAWGIDPLFRKNKYPPSTGFLCQK